MENKGCPLCSYEDRFLNTDIFKEKSNKIHNNFYNYSEVIYIHSEEKVKVICPDHGEFFQVANEHIRGAKCPICARKNSLVFSKTSFIKKCKEKRKKGVFYIIQCFNENESFYKVGITSDSIKKRYTCYKDMPYSFNIIQEIIEEPNLIWDLETLFKDFILKNKILYKPKLKFNGYKTECFIL